MLLVCGVLLLAGAGDSIAGSFTRHYGDVLIDDDLDVDGRITGYTPISNGSFLQSFNATVVSDGATVTMGIEKSGGGDLTMQFSDGPTTLDCTPGLTVNLTAGSNSSPQGNYVYVSHSSHSLSVDTSSFPTASEHIKVGYFLVPSAAHVVAEGAYINQNWNDHQYGTDNMGHLQHIAERSRRDGAYWFSGVAPNGTIAAVSSYIHDAGGGVYHFKSTSGVIYQMHRHSISAKDSSSDDIHVVNWNGDPYYHLNDLAEIVNDANGVTLNNKYYNLVFWGVGNKTGEYAPIMCNLPTGSYNTLSAAQADLDGYDVLTMPREFNLESSTGFLIARVTVRQSGGTWTYHSTVDLRGQTPQTATGGALGVTHEFPDNQFKVYDETDITKILEFDTGESIPTATTVTLTVGDASGTVVVLVGDDLTLPDDLTVTGDMIVSQSVSVGGALTPSRVVADPCGTYAEGSIFYNDTSNYMCYCDGTNDVQMHDPTTSCF